MNSNSFSFFDYWQAAVACGPYFPDEKQKLEDYLLRKRKEELCALVQKVIRNELDERDQLLVRLRWYKGKSVSQIASLLQLDRSTIFRHMERIENLIFDKLKYAMEYRYGEQFSADAKTILHREIPDALRVGGVKTIGARLKYLRSASFMTPKQVCASVGIPADRLKKLEADGAEMTMTELKKFCRLFNVSTDQLIFGTNPPQDTCASA